MKTTVLLLLHEVRLSVAVYTILVCCVFGSLQVLSPTTHTNLIQAVSTFENAGDGPSSACVTTLSINLIATSVEFFICHLSFIFDTYIGTTPDIFDSNSPLGHDYLYSLYAPLKNLALFLIPILLVISVGILVIQQEVQHLGKLLISFISSIIWVLLLPDIFRLSIELNNSICQYIIDIANGGHSIALSSMLNSSIDISGMMQGTILPAIAETILWVFFLISMLFICIFFIIRFVVIAIIALFMPIALVLKVIPGLALVHETMVTKMIQFILVQPLVLLGINFIILLMKQSIDDIGKVILAACSFITLGILPSLIMGITGGKIYGISIIKVKEIFEGIKARAEIVGSWIDDGEPEPVPFIKPNKR